ncbi:MAG TPA: dihydrodipicolinate synthase family protein [Castellaniella sp.]|jgi:4-hydroxy-tetrahydrodipicolinate synthase|nr:dihydrodipicolinate synthase family protein [Castellaniella sp.]
MGSSSVYTPEGVIPAVLMPFQADLEIDRGAYQRHVQDLAGTAGVTGLVVNGHAAEVHTLSFDEQKLALDLTLDTVGDKTPIICGIYAESTRYAQKLARMAAAGGARCLLAFPPNVLMFRGEDRPELFVDYYQALADTTDLPIVLFQFPKWTGLQLSFDTLIKVCETIPQIVAIKDMCSDPALHEKQIRNLHALARPVSVLTTHSSWLMGSVPMGVRGIISGAGSVIANLQVALFEAFQQHDLMRAQAVGDRVYAAVQAFYEAPYIDWQARMKESLVALGRLPNAYVRPPLKATHNPERLARWLREAGLTPESVYAKVA